MRLIDADDAVMRLREAGKDMKVVPTVGCKAIDFAVVPRFIEGMPTIDAVPVVRCEKCDWYREDGSICVNPKCGKSYYGCRVPEQHFCSYGERRSDENS